LTINLKNENGIEAALYSNPEGDSAWFAKMDENTGTAIYENLEGRHERRTRLRVEGAILGTSFTSITSIDGFWMQYDSGANPWVLISFSGTPSLGMIGDQFRDGNSLEAGDCYWPGSAAAPCTGVTPIGGLTQANGDALVADMDAAITALSGSQAALVDFTTVDPSVTDVTQ